MTTTAYTWEITDAVVATSTQAPGSACPASSKSAHSGSTGNVIVLCGRNHASSPHTPLASLSTLGGTFIGSHGAFTSGLIPATSGNVVIGNWSNVTVTSAFGSGKTVVATVGSAVNQTSPVTTLTGYDAISPGPVAADDSYSTAEDTELDVPVPGVLGNDVDPLSQPMTAVLDTGPGHAASFTLNSDGSFSYTPAADYNGSDSFTYHANDGTFSGNTATVTITVSAVNDAPVVHVPGGQTLNEDHVLTFSTGNSNLISATDVDAGSGSVTADLTVSHGVLAVSGTTGLTPSSLPPAAHLNFSGTLSDVNAALDGLTYTPAGDFNGSDLLTFSINDNGNTGSGGALSDSNTVAITINPVNDAPSFSLPGSPDQTVLEDAGAQTVSGFATNISPGPADESGQTVTFHVSNDNIGLFSTQPSIDETSGDLTYTPAADANGSATVSVYLTDNGGTANGGADTSATQQFTISVTAVNDPPSFDLPASADQSVLRDSGAQTVSGFATNISPGPADESSQTVTFHVSNDNNGLFSTQPSIDETSGDLTYTPAAGQTGSALVSVYLTDDGGTANGGSNTSGTQTFTITVHPPNAPPTDITLTPSSVDENLPSGTTVGTLTTTDADAGETFTYSLVTGTGDDDNASFTLSGDTVQTAASFNFEAKSSYSIRVQTADSGPGNLTFQKAITITINDVNEAPTDIQLSNDSIPENSGVNATIGTFSSTDPDTGDTHTYTLVSGIGSTDNAGFNITAGGDLRENGSFDFETQNSFSIRVRSTDSGGLFTEKVFTINVTDVNEAPTDIQLSNSSIDENQPSGTDIGTLTSTDPDFGDTHTYTLENTGCGGGPFPDNSSFQIGGVNSDKLQSAASFDFETKSSYTVCLRSTDSGSLSFDKQFTITINNVNEAPTDISLSNNSIDENKPSGSLVGNLSQVGDPDSGETYTFTLLTSGCSGSFPDSSSFQISGAQLQSAVSFNFEVKNSYTICVRVNDPGSPNLSFSKQLTIAINDVNDPPVDGNESVSAVGNTLLEYGSVPSPSSAAKKVVAGNLLANATDEDQPPQTLTISASDTTSAQGGSVSVSAAGAFSYLPPAGFTGTDTFNYTVSDGNGGTDTSTVTITVASRVWYVKNNATPGGLGRSTDPFDTLSEADTAANATGDITYVYKGDGTTTGLTGGFSLLTNQKLLGEPVNLVVGADTLATGTPANRPSLSGTVALASGSRVEGVDIAGSGGNPAIGGTNTGGSDVTNVNLSGTGGVALQVGCAGTFNFTNFTINTTGVGFYSNCSGSPTINVGSGATENVSATGQPAVSVIGVNGASSLAFDAVSSTNSTGDGIDFEANGAATFSASSGSISGAAGNAIDIAGGSGNITYPGTLGNGAGNTADITGRTGGAIALSGNINDTNDAGGGITMSGNTGGSTTFSGTTKTLNTGASAAFSSTGSGQTITFSNGGLNIDTTSGAGFSATGGGTVNVTGTVNTIDTTTGTALNVSSTNIGASGLTFEHISANGAASGIVLSSTGTSGGLTVTGTGSAGSGGTLNNIPGADLATNNCGAPGGTAGVGVFLSSTSSPSLSWMNFTGTFGNFGILGYSVNGLTLSHDSLTGTFGDNVNVDDDAVHFCTLTGSATISNSSIQNGAETNLRVVNASGTLNRLTLTNDTIGLNQTNGGDGTLFEADGGTFNATVEDTTFQGSRGSPFQAVPQVGATMDLVFGAPGHGNTIHNTHSNIVPFAQDLNVAAGGNLTFDINSNHFDSTSAVQAQGGVFINAANSTAVASGYFRNNTIGNSGVANSGSSGNDPALDVESNGGGDLTIVIDSNQMYQWGSNGAGFLVQAGATSGNPVTFNVTATNNTIAQPGTFAVANNAEGFQLNNGTNSGENFTSCLNFATNTVNGSGTGPGGDVRLRQRFDTKVDLPGYTGAADGTSGSPTIVTYVQTKNPTGPPSVTSVSSTLGGGGFFNTPGGAACATPGF